MVALDEGTTNQGFLLELLGRPELRAGEVDTGWLDRLQAQGDVEPMRHADAALVQAAIALCDAATAADRGRFYALARRGRPHAEADVGHQVDLLHRGASYRMSVCQTGPGRYRVEVDGARIEAEVEEVSEHERRLRFGGRSHRTMTALQDRDLLVEVDGVPHRISRDEGGLVRSQAPGVVVAVPVAAGDEVRAGDVVAVTESMKMELSLTAPVDGRVREVLVVRQRARRPRAGRCSAIEPLEDAPAAGRGERVTLRRPTEAATDGLERLAWLVLGYDVPAADVRRIVDEVTAAPPDPEREHRLLEIYADVRALNRPHPDAGREAEVMGSPQEHLHAFLRSLDPAAEGLPDRFVAHLERARRPLRDRRAGAHRARSRTPATGCSSPSSARRRRARRGAGDPHAPARAGRRRRRASELRGVLDRLEADARPRASRRWPSSRASCAGGRCDEPLVEAAREETAEAMEAPPRRARPRARARSDRDAPHGRARRLPAAARAAAQPARRRRRSAASRR